MVTQELIQYIKSQLQSGQTKDAIKSNLISKGWPISDIESAFQTVILNPVPEVLQQNPTNLSKSHNLSSTLIFIIIFIILGVSGIIYAAFFRNINPLSKKEVLNPTLTVRLTTTISPTINQSNLDETIFYSSPQQGYGFRYLKLWKINKQGTLTVLANPSNPNMQECAAVIAKFLACDTLISSVPYQETETSVFPGVTIIEQPTVKSHSDQIKDIATQMAVGNSINPITLNNLNGYEVPTTNHDVSTFNVLLQGSKNIILIQFPNKKLRKDLNKGQIIVLESVIEQ